MWWRYSKDYVTVPINSCFSGPLIYPFMFYSFKGIRPVADKTSFIHPQAVVTGDVIIGKYCYIGPGAALRGDWGRIIIEDGCNVQENCTIHMFPGTTVILREGAHIGHGAVIHGAQIGKNCLVGMNSVIMDQVDLGDESVVGALTFIKEGTVIPPRSVVLGSPGKVIKQVTDQMLDWKTAGTRLYQELPRDCADSLKPCKPRRKPAQILQKDHSGYKSWKKSN